jgi:hypothetical protein
MMMQTVTFQLPENLYTRLQQAAKATRRPFNEVLIHSLQVGSPPVWDDAPEEFQADLAALDRLEDDALWRIARAFQTKKNMGRYDELLDKNANQTLSAQEREELSQLRYEADRLMLQKAQAVALLRWRGYAIPPAEQLRGPA